MSFKEMKKDIIEEFNKHNEYIKDYATKNSEYIELKKIKNRSYDENKRMRELKKTLDELKCVYTYSVNNWLKIKYPGY